MFGWLTSTFFLGTVALIGILYALGFQVLDFD